MTTVLFATGIDVDGKFRTNSWGAAYGCSKRNTGS